MISISLNTIVTAKRIVRINKINAFKNNDHFDKRIIIKII